MHQIKNYDHLIGKIDGLSEKQIKAHIALYEGYVNKCNEIQEKLKKADVNSANYSYGEISELQRRLSVPYNGAMLHELYFDNLNSKPTECSSDLCKAIENSYGSMDQWMANAKATLLSSPGWLLVTRSKKEDKIRNILIEEHHRGLLVGQDIILALDGWEHAYMIDYGIAKAEYIKTLEKNIDWKVASDRYRESLGKEAMQIAA